VKKNYGKRAEMGKEKDSSIYRKHFSNRYISSLKFKNTCHRTERMKG